MPYDFRPRISTRSSQDYDLGPDPLAVFIDRLERGFDKGTETGRLLAERRRRQDAVKKFSENFPELESLATTENIDVLNMKVAHDILSGKFKSPSPYAQVAGDEISVPPGYTRIFQHPKTGEVSREPVEGWIPSVVKEGQALQAMTTQRSGNIRSHSLDLRTEAWDRSIDSRQTDILLKASNPSGSILKTLAQNNLRIARVARSASQGPISWQQANLLQADLVAAINGGVPHIDQLVATKYPNWKEKLAYWNTFFTGDVTKNVPTQIQDEMLRMAKDFVKIDNEAIRQNADMIEELILPTIREGKKLKPSVEKGVKTFMNISEQHQFGSEKEKRYQEWKKIHGY